MLFPPTWPTVGVPQKIAADQIHVWAWLLDSGGLDDHEKSEIGLLDAKELERFHRFHFECDRARFAIAHANVRRILGAYLGQEPKRILFRANPFGKPELVTRAQAPPLYFNLSHSRNIALLALSMDTELGIDIEYLRPIEPEVAESNFSPTELAALSTLEGEAWLKGFYHCWTRKEAIL
jgi:4'-phosphopantetheinyl transferase